MTHLGEKDRIRQESLDVKCLMVTDTKYSIVFSLFLSIIRLVDVVKFITDVFDTLKALRAIIYNQVVKLPPNWEEKPQDSEE